MARATTVRMDPNLLDDLALVARVDDMPASEAIRRAVTAYIADRRADPAFQTAAAALAGDLISRLGRLA